MTEAGTLTVLSHRLFAELTAELGGEKRALRWLVKQSTRANMPIGINLPTTEGGVLGPTTTIFVAPKGWSDERLRGWIAGRHREIETLFGSTTGIRSARDTAKV